MLDILSVCCNETATVDSFSVFRRELKLRPAKVYVRMRGYDVGGKEGYPYAALELKDFGGMEGVARWFEVTEEYGAAVTLLTSNWYNENAYAEDKFSRMYVAVESLLSRKKNRKSSSMTFVELATFAEEAIPGFSRFTNRPSEEWAESVKAIRDQKISHSDPTSTLNVGWARYARDDESTLRCRSIIFVQRNGHGQYSDRQIYQGDLPDTSSERTTVGETGRPSGIGRSKRVCYRIAPSWTGGVLGGIAWRI